MRAMPLLQFLALLAAVPAAAQQHQHGKQQLGAHEHGRGFLNIAIEGTRVTLEFQAPGSDIARSETKPNTPERKAASDAALATLEQPLELFRLPAAAQCTVVQAKSRMTIIGDGEPGTLANHGSSSHAKHGKHAHKSGEDHRGHSDYHGSYHLDCAVPAQLTAIELPYFKVFPRAEKVTIQVIGPRGQASGEATAKSPVFRFAGAF